MAEDMRMAKFELLIIHLNEKAIAPRCRRDSRSSLNKGDAMQSVKGRLCLIFDDDSLSEYGKVILDKAIIYRRLLQPGRFKLNESTNESKPAKAKEAALNLRVDRGRSGINNIDSYLFLFWALMILTVDETQQEKLPLICDFARMMNVTDEEMLDLVSVIKYVYHEGEASLVKTENVKEIFSDVLTMYDYTK